jgi:hypothetical protein
MDAFYVVKVFFTLDSIRGKTTGEFRPMLRRFKGELEGHAIDRAYMDEVTAKYDSEFICEPAGDSHPPHLNWVGYELNQWIAIKHKKP